MDGDANLSSSPTARPSRSRLFVAVVLLLAIGTVVAIGWAATRWQSGLSLGQSLSGAAGSDPASADGARNAMASTQGTAGAPGTALPGVPQTLDARALELEQRLLRISVAAQAASGYANRAEAMMVAFAARRALDAGTPLGFMEGQIRVIFGEAQPKAVATILNAANDPVTVNKLRAGLEDIMVLFDQGNPNASWWSSTMRELSTLVVIRRAGTPPPEPEQRLARARRAVEAGQIEDAIRDVAALPPQPAIAQWLEQARRYNEAHRALDVIEAAAILEPRAVPIVAPVTAAGPTDATQ